MKWLMYNFTGFDGFSYLYLSGRTHALYLSSSYFSDSRISDHSFGFLVSFTEVV